jgi:hypothetical protein
MVRFRGASKVLFWAIHEKDISHSGISHPEYWGMRCIHLAVRRTRYIRTFSIPGGEDDFSQRAAYFLFGVCPAFLLLGAWIGYAGFGNMRRWFAMWVGVFVGAVVVLAGAASLRGSRLRNLSEDGAANRAVLLFYGAWVASSTLAP